MSRPFERTFVAFVASSSIAITIAQGANAVLRAWFPMLTQTSATALTLSVVIISFGFAITQLFSPQTKHFFWVALLISVSGSFFLAVFGNGFGTASITVVIVGIIQAYLARLISSRLPSSIDISLRRHKVRSLLWAILGILLVVQTGRLGTYMSDPSVDWWLTTRNEWWAKHMCMPAYIQAADYNQQGEANIYDERHYPAIIRNANLHLTVQQMDAFVGDPYQYPPQFLLAPSAALWLTNDFLTMRTVWYSLQVLGFVLIAVLLAWWVRYEAGWSPMLLIPLVWISVPAMQCFQFGQFHLATILLAVAGMLAFEHKRQPLGGLLLAAAILSKLFPAILLVPMIVQRRWKDLAWTALFGIAITLLALLILGPKPFSAFTDYQIPRLAGGGAFAAFTKEWPELRDLVTANIVSLYGVVFKLRELGVGGMSDELAIWVMRIYTVIVLIIALAAGRFRYNRLHAAITWFALLNLASLQTSLAWGDYFTVGTIWLLSLLSSQTLQKSWNRVLIGACWIFTTLNLGIVPMPELPPKAVMMIVTSIGAVLLFVLNAWVALRKQTDIELHPIAQ